MPFDSAALLAPVSEDRPCGVPLDSLGDYDEFRSLVSSPQRADWARHLDRALALARASRDLRAWVWLTRASLCAEGVPGLAAGLRLMAEGLERYWDDLPPQHADESDPRERFMMRLSALAQLGVTNFGCNLDELLRGGRTVPDLRADLDAMVAKALPDAATRQAVDDARAATGRIAELFTRRFGAGRDPQLGFAVILDKLKAIEPKLAAAAPDGQATRPAASANGFAHALAPGPVASREDVVRALDLVVEYYRSNEPSSPVPLLVERAKRLVPLSFLDAIRDLAPAGLKELQAVAGGVEEKK